MSSEYEHNIAKLLFEKKQKLDQLLENPQKTKYEIELLSNEIETLKTLFENYNLGMNVFRRAQGGRSHLRE
jgi:colicin import membrane protein